MKIDRLLATTNLLINKKKLTAKYLAEHFEVSVRTIYRDIASLEMSGIPIITYQGVDGGIGIMDDYKLDKEFFKPEELWNIIKALDSISFTDEKLNYTIAKLKSKILDKNFKEIKNKDVVRVKFNSYYSSKKQSEKFEQLKKAIENEKIISFNYRNNKAELSLRKVEPLVLTYKNYNAYLTGFCLLKNDYRFFKLNRIRNLEIKEDTFQRNKRQFPDLFENTEQNFKYINLKLKFDPDYIHKVEEYFEEENISVLEDTSLIVDVSFPMNEWVENFILNFGDKVEILEPIAFRNQIKEKIKNMYNKYF